MDFLQQRRGAQPRRRSEHGLDLTLSDCFKWIDAVRQVRASRSDGNESLASIRHAERTLMAVFAAATSCRAWF
jgi:hypothetical protein